MHKQLCTAAFTINVMITLRRARGRDIVEAIARLRRVIEMLERLLEIP